ncbi:MAG: hypothetical protein B6D58_04025 [candidate division Zixibacteria bacterium 4484_95]|nr:MAG: hypothetical protein B6D58_04025 [candidate division Zixibacteria bacterium 4484_95]
MEANKTLIWLNITIVLFAWMVSVVAFNELPERIPTHFGLNGKPDRWSDKTPLIFYMMPTIQVVMVVIFIWIIRYPKLFNFPQKNEIKNWPEENKKPIYKYLSKMSLVICLMINLLFLTIQYSIIYGAKTETMSKIALALIIIMTFSFIPLTVFILANLNKIIKETKKTLSYQKVI